MVEAEKFLRRGESDEAPGVKKSYARAEEKGFANVVRDENDGFLEAVGEGGKFALKLGARDGI